MASEYEKIVLGGLDFNDGTKIVLEDMSFKQAEAKPQFVGNGDADGEALIEEPHYTNAYFELQVRIVPQANTDAALKVVGEISDKLQLCARTDEGLALTWTPNESATTYTYYALVGEVAELPIMVSGDMAGWFVESPVLKIKLTCRPFGHAAERVVLAATPAETQLQVAYIEGIKGDVPAEGRMVVTDNATKNRRFLEWGGDVVDSKAGNPSLVIEGGSFTVTGMAGEASTRAGAVSTGTKVVKSSVLTFPVTVCSSGSIKNVGSYRMKLRVQATGGASLRAAYRVGEGPLTSGQWVPVFATEKWVELDLGEAFLEKAEKGEQISQILIQGKSTATCLVYVDTLNLVPTKRYALSRGVTNFAVPSTLVALDRFITTPAGALTGKVAETGGTWAGAGDADDFQINTTYHIVQRTALSDASNVPRYGLLGTNKYTNITAGIDVISSNPREEFSSCANMGLILRYVDVNNWAKLELRRSAIGGGNNHWYCYFRKKVAGVESFYIGVNGFSSALGPNGDYSAVMISPFNVQFATWVRLEATILEDGSFKVGAKGEVYLTGQDNVFATGGALAEGRIGISDEKTVAGAETRYYGSFSAYTPTVNVICNSNKAVEVRSYDTQFQNTTGTYWSPVPQYRGSGLYLDPAGDQAKVNRLAVKMRRGDSKVEPDNNPTDKQTLEVLARERFLRPR